VKRGVLSAGHDVSDGGTIVALLEMAFAGNCGVTAAFPLGPGASEMGVLFSEELGFFFEVLPQNLQAVLGAFEKASVPAEVVGEASAGPQVSVSVGGREMVKGEVGALRDVWESTSFALERLQTLPTCVDQEQRGLGARRGPAYRLTFSVHPTPPSPSSRPRVAIIRQEGSNGDREMSAAFTAGGFEAWDVNMQDLMAGDLTLEGFRGLAFCGGFSFADVADSAKGWAAVIRFNPSLLEQFTRFRDRAECFSLGVCNGCQLLALLGWVPFQQAPEPSLQARFVHNLSGRFESRWTAVKVDLT